MNVKDTPSPEGLRRWPHTAGYHPDISAETTAPDHSLPCTCGQACAPRCAGKCGCKACNLAFVEYCDVAGLYGPDGLSVPEEEARSSYRSMYVPAAPSPAD